MNTAGTKSLNQKKKKNGRDTEFTHTDEVSDMTLLICCLIFKFSCIIAF